MKPISFNEEMVNAILDGRKTVTRRKIKPQPIREQWGWEVGNVGWNDSIRTLFPTPGNDLYDLLPYHPGDILWVREIWSPVYVRPRRYIYKADVDRGVGEGVGLPLRWHHPNKMPREAARICLRVTGVRVERLQDISGEDIRSEGVLGKHFQAPTRGAFADVWNRTIKPKDLSVFGWDANHWIWVIEFKQIDEKDGVNHDK